MLPRSPTASSTWGGDAVAEHESALVSVARNAEPHELFKVIRHLREAVYPDDLDKAWAEGMDREDFQVNAVPDGFHVNGFLNPIIGAKLKAVHDSASKPTGPDDLRTGAQRRVAGIDALMTALLESGLPSDNGVRPQLSVILDATHDGPTQLAGYGSIGPRLLDYLTCTADITPIHTRIRRDSRCRTHPTPRDRPSTQGGLRSTGQRVRLTRLSQHPSRDPSRHLVVQRWQDQPRQPRRTLLSLPSPAAPRAAPHHGQRHKRIRVHQPSPPAAAQTAKKQISPSRLTRPAAHRHDH